MKGRSQSRRAFTLIEVVLAIGLSAVLLGLLVLAVDQYVVNVRSSREAVEHAHVVRGVVRMIADDLRSAATPYEQDVSTVAELAAAAAAADFDSDSIDDPAETFEDLAGGGGESPRPPLGVSGDSATLEVDVLRTRRPRAVQPAEVAAPTAESPPNAARLVTVRYSLAPGGGLVRQEVARDVAAWQEQRGQTTAWDAAHRVVAEEVAAIAFRYGDGAELLEAWDQDERGGASPLVVEVRLAFRDERDEQTDPRRAPRVRWRRVLVALPPAQPDASQADGEQEPSPADALGSATR